MDAGSLSANPRVQQLFANIQHLKGQLYLATAAIQLKDATIGQLSTTIDSQRRALSGEIMQSSLQLVTSSEAPDDEEEIIEGVVTLKKYEGKGFIVNLPELYRRFRQKFLTDHNENPTILRDRDR